MPGHNKNHRAARFNPADTEIDGILIDWAHEFDGKIAVIRELGWGWEEWAQADHAFHLRAVLDGHCAWREEWAYHNSRERADIIVRDDHNKPVHLFELKCKSASISNDHFHDGLVDDYIKIQQTLSTEYKTARGWVVGFYFDEFQIPKGFTNVTKGQAKLCTRS